MIITSINYSKNRADGFDTDQNVLVYKLNYGQKEHRNLVCVDETESGREVEEALRFLFDKENTDKETSVSVQFVDNNGNTWMVEKKYGVYKIYQNNSVVDGIDFNSFINDILLDESFLKEDTTQSDSSATNSNVLIKSIDLFIKDHTLYSRSIDSKEDSSLESKKQVKDLISSKVKEINKSLFNLGLRALSYKEASFINSYMQKIYLRYQEVKNQQKLGIKDEKSLEVYDANYIEKLSKEVSCLKKMFDKATPILNSEPIKNIKDNILREESQIKDLISKYNLSMGTNPPWSELIQSLSQVEIYKKLLLSSQKMKSLRTVKIDSVYKDFIQNLQDLLSNSSQITSDLEHSLGVLSSYLEDDKKSGKRNISTLFKGFVSPDSQVSNGSDKLENSKASVDFALSRLGELHSKLNIGKKDYLDFITKLEEAHDLLGLEYTRIRGNWTKLCKEYNVDPGINLEQLMKVVTVYYDVSEKIEKHKRYKKEYLKKQNSINSLKTLVEEWRTLTNSQKDDDLSNPAILLAEIEGILRYKKKKEEQLVRLESISSKYKVEKIFTSIVENTLKDLDQKWVKACEKLGNFELSITSTKSPFLFSKSRELENYYQLLSSEYDIKEQSEIFSESNVNGIINFVKVSNMGEEFVENIENLIEASENSNIIFLFLKTNSIFTELKNRGFSQLIKVEKTYKNSGQTPITEDSAKRARVQSVLNIFARPLNK